MVVSFASDKPDQIHLLHAMNNFPTTFLFCPGNRPERFHKAFTSGAPGVVLDLEDAVPDAQKSMAREASLTWLSQHRHRSSFAPQLALRVNTADSAHGLEDLYQLVHADQLPDSLVLFLPKVSSAAELQLIGAHLLRAQPRWQLLPLIESASGLANAAAIARAHPAVRAIGFGAADLSTELGVAHEWEPLLYARSRLVMETAGTGVALLDVPHLDIHDEAALRLGCERALALGFHGKFAIHPAQVAAIVASFEPTATQQEQAHRIVSAFEDAGRQACMVDGRMVDEPVYRAALKLLARVSTPAQV